MTDGELEVTCVLNGGDPFGSGEAVKPGVLSVLGTVQQTLIPDTIEELLKDFTPATVKRPLEVLREAVEENTGENFSFIETLHGYAELLCAQPI